MPHTPQRVGKCAPTIHYYPIWELDFHHKTPALKLLKSHVNFDKSTKQIPAMSATNNGPTAGQGWTKSELVDAV
jgi:hypothetical protein